MVRDESLLRAVTLEVTRTTKATKDTRNPMNEEWSDSECDLAEVATPDGSELMSFRRGI
jgi:hypothetical protein